MLCIIYNESKDRLIWKFGPCSKDLRKWAKENKEEGDTIKYMEGADWGSKPRIPGFEFLSLGNRFRNDKRKNA